MFKCEELISCNLLSILYVYIWELYGRTMQRTINFFYLHRGEEGYVSQITHNYNVNYNTQLYLLFHMQRKQAIASDMTN